MPLETPVYINDLVTTNPAGTDERRFGDDHIRNIKTALKNTFPSATGPIVFPRLNTTILTSNTTLVVGDDGKLFLVDSGTTNFTLSLPAIAGLTAGWNIRVKNITAVGGGGNRFVLIDPNASEVIEGAASFKLYFGEDVNVVYVGGNFRVFGAQSRVLLSSQTLANVSSIACNELGSRAPRFTSFEFQFEDFIAVSNAQSLCIRVSGDNGANYSSTGYTHARVGGTAGATTATSAGSDNDSSIVLMSGMSNNVANGHYAAGMVRLVRPTGRQAFLWNMGAYSTGGSGITAHTSGTGRQGGAMDAVQFFFTGGNISGGTVRCYGMV